MSIVGELYITWTIPQLEWYMSLKSLPNNKFFNYHNYIMMKKNFSTLPLLSFPRVGIKGVSYDSILDWSTHV